MISIVVPTLDEERSFPVLDAILQQGAEHEVIVADGGSQDRTPEVACDHKVRRQARKFVLNGWLRAGRKHW